ncbi:MAG: hypothetical protein FWE05_10565 [Defluviitaleaceae bacterium]|nr:hypothetical protein [Defluviitaleaceae bacterium]
MIDELSYILSGFAPIMTTIIVPIIVAIITSLITFYIKGKSRRWRRNRDEASVLRKYHTDRKNGIMGLNHYYRNYNDIYVMNIEKRHSIPKEDEAIAPSKSITTYIPSFQKLPSGADTLESYADGRDFIFISIENKSTMDYDIGILFNDRPITLITSSVKGIKVLSQIS